MTAERPLVLYHGLCADGFAAAWIVKRCHPENAYSDAEFVPVFYGYPPPDVTGCDVLLLDFAYPRDVMRDMYEKASSLQVYDHHRSAEKQLKDLDFCYFDLERSGAMLAWMEVCGREEPQGIPYYRSAWLPAYIQDRDLWRWELRLSKEVSASISSYPFTFEAWDELVSVGVARHARDGGSILRYQQRLVEDFLSEGGVGAKLVGSRGIAVRGRTLVSETCHYLLQEHSWAEWAGALFRKDDGRMQLSLRARRDDAVDVERIAVSLGGGGHKKSAAIVFDPQDDKLEPNLRDLLNAL